MATEVDICNLALANLGDDATIATLSPPEGSAQAEKAARFYPIARNSLLAMHTWSFASKRGSLALTTNTLDQWDYAYIAPSDMMSPVAIISPSSLASLLTYIASFNLFICVCPFIIYTSFSTRSWNYICQEHTTTNDHWQHPNHLSKKISHYISWNQHNSYLYCYVFYFHGLRITPDLVQPLVLQRLKYRLFVVGSLAFLAVSINLLVYLPLNSM